MGHTQEDSTPRLGVVESRRSGELDTKICATFHVWNIIMVMVVTTHHQRGAGPGVGGAVGRRRGLARVLRRHRRRLQLPPDGARPARRRSTSRLFVVGTLQVYKDLKRGAVRRCAARQSFYRKSFVRKRRWTELGPYIEDDAILRFLLFFWLFTAIHAAGRINLSRRNRIDDFEEIAAYRAWPQILAMRGPLLLSFRIRRMPSVKFDTKGVY